MYKKAQEFHNKEWLSQFMNRYKFTPLWAGLAMALLNLVIDLPLALHFDSLLPSDVGKGLLGEPSDWLYEFVVHPIILAYFCWLQTAGIKLVDRLANEKFEENQKDVQMVLEKWSQRMQSKWVFRVATLGGFLFVFWFLLAFAPSLAFSPYETSPYSSWITANSLIAFIRGPVIFVVVYALIIVVINLIIISRVLNELMSKRTVKIEPFHPDKAGGLGFIGRFTANLSYIIGALGILLFSRILQDPENLYDERSYVLLLGIILYLIVAPLIFFMPLRMTHVAMVNFRNKLLGEIATQIESALEKLGIYPRYISGEDAKQSVELNAAQVKELTDKVEHFNGMRDFVKENVPTWPFATGSLSKFYGIVLAPLVPTLISIVRELLFG